ncbi:hypothetical protein IHE61_21470 [Streptomyces sp. GKU 257-1]|nr:hypothetical protein [Streptomyces sp. GKU 257-1]
MSASEHEAGEQRVRDAVRRHARTRAFTEAEDVISFLSRTATTTRPGPPPSD